MSDTATLAPPDPRYSLPKIPFPLEPLKLTDTCDRCGPGVSAYAQVRLGIAAGLVYDAILRFCGHCFTRYEATFVAAGYEIKDERDRLNAANLAFKGGTE